MSSIVCSLARTAKLVKCEDSAQASALIIMYQDKKEKRMIDLTEDDLPPNKKPRLNADALDTPVTPLKLVKSVEQMSPVELITRRFELEELEEAKQSLTVFGQ